MPLVAIRGATRVKDEIELQAHLAALLRLENAGLLLGAGASCSAGGKTMAGLWKDFEDANPNDAKWLRDQGFFTAHVVFGGGAGTVPNLEVLIDSIEVALIEWRRRGDKLLADLERVRASLFRAVVRAALLKETWWDSIEGAESDVDELEHHRTILQKLVSARQPGQASPWVFTTNYDLAVEWAAESIDLQVVNGFLGVHSRRFSPQSFDLGFRNTQARGEARFGCYNIYLAKLHGSLTWQEHNEQLFEIPAPLAWQKIRAFLDDATTLELGLMVLPRAAKYLQTVGFTLGELLRRFSEFLSRPQTSLIISGYSFGDEHINRLMRSALLNPTLQLVIYYPEFDGNAGSPSLPKALRKLLSLKNPRVTVVGGGEAAFLDKLAGHLPDPLLYDDEMQRLERALRDDAKKLAVGNADKVPL
jgi:hypothetical protein